MSGECLRCHMDSLMLSEDGFCGPCALRICRILELLIRLGRGKK